MEVLFFDTPYVPPADDDEAPYFAWHDGEFMTFEDWAFLRARDAAEEEFWQTTEPPYCDEWEQGRRTA